MGTENSAPEPTPEQEAENCAAFLKAADERPEGHIVCATLGEDGRPLYFYAPKDASSETIRDLAFERRNGRGMTKYERAVLAEAQRERTLA